MDRRGVDLERRLGAAHEKAPLTCACRKIGLLFPPEWELEVPITARTYAQTYEDRSYRRTGDG
jgi:hypothetical protein